MGIGTEVVERVRRGERSLLRDPKPKHPVLGVSLQVVCQDCHCSTHRLSNRIAPTSDITCPSLAVLVDSAIDV